MKPLDRDLLAYGISIERDGERVDPRDFFLSPEDNMSPLETLARDICEVDCGRVTDNELARCEDLARTALQSLIRMAEELGEERSAVFLQAMLDG